MVADVLIEHVTRCRQLPRLQYAFPIIIPEANMATQALELQRTLKFEKNFSCQFMTEDKHSKHGRADMPGIYTTHHTKQEMVLLFINHYLSKNRIFVHRPFIVAASMGAEITLGIGDVRTEFESEMREFSRVGKERRAADGTPWMEFFYHGKINGNDDDFVMATLFAPYAYRIFCTKPKYQSIRAL